MAYIGKSPGTGIRNRFIYTATAGQTTFSGTDDHNRTLSYTDAEFVDVFLNGVKLDKSDYTATSGTSIVLDEGAAVDDILEVLAFDIFSIFTGEFSQDVTVGGTQNANGNGDVAGDLTTNNINGGQIGGRRNLIINGAMTVSQRSTSVAGITSSGYKTVDRFKTNISNLGTYTQSQSTSAPNGFSNSLKMDCTIADASPAAGDYLNIATIFEGQDLQHIKKGTSDALQMTLSFWVKSAKTGTYIVEFNDTDNSRSTSQSYTILAADTWEQKVINVPADTTGTLTNDANASLEVIFWLAAGSNLTSGTLATVWESRTNANRAAGQVNLSDSDSNDWYITGVQLEVGSTATKFEHRSYGEELALCQRYFQLNTAATGKATTTTRIQMQIPHIVSMRANPTVTIKDGTSGAGDIGISARNITAVYGYVNRAPNGSSIQLTISTTNNGNVHELYADRLNFDSEL